MKTTFLLTLGVFCVTGVAIAADPVPPCKPVIDATVPPKLPARATID